MLEFPFPIRVVHVRHWTPRPNEIDVYIGRAMPGFAASPLANQARLHFESDRDEVIGLYRIWLTVMLRDKASDQSIEIERIRSLLRIRPVALTCWCRPKACHGDPVIKAVLGRLEI